jgi:uncharacterized membrane protein
VAVNGTYQFEVPNGKYKVKAFYRTINTPMGAEENLTIVDDGIYVRDLFLYPNIKEEDLYSDVNLTIFPPFEKQANNVWLWVLIPIILVMGVFLILIFKLNTKLMKKEIDKEIQEEEDDLKKIISLLKKNNGRLTQKQIRAELPYSEAKISLMIAELEEKGKVKKIKRGRGNILILR